MKASELRIGNYINYNKELNELGKITSIESFVSGQYKIGINNRVNKKHYCDTVEPIPLTEEWLLKFGFEKVNRQFYKKEIGENVFVLVNYNKSPRGSFGAVTFETDLKENSYVGHIKNKCKHIHSLQNLYFALTGEELSII